MTLLVTGCGGFVGEALALRAIARGRAVVGVGRSVVSTGVPYPVIAADLTRRDWVDLLDEFQVSAVFHAAGAASVAESLADPAGDLLASVGTLSPILEAARRARAVPRVVFPSSAAVYGSVDGAIDERCEAGPVSPYGFHKVACELLMDEYRQCFGVESMAVRIFSTYGPGQRRLLLWEVYEQARVAGRVVLQGTGTEERDYLYIDDLADGVLDLLTTRELPRVVNLASGRSITTRRLAEVVLEALGSPSQNVRCLGNIRSGDPARWRADISLLRRLCQREFRAVTQGIAECIAMWEATRSEDESQC